MSAQQNEVLLRIPFTGSSSSLAAEFLHLLCFGAQPVFIQFPHTINTVNDTR